MSLGNLIDCPNLWAKFNRPLFRPQKLVEKQPSNVASIGTDLIYFTVKEFVGYLQQSSGSVDIQYNMPRCFFRCFWVMREY